jgi:hypothetical protein
LPPASLIPVVNLELRISSRIFEKIRNGPNGSLRGLGETDSQKKPEAKNLVTLSLKFYGGAMSAARQRGKVCDFVDCCGDCGGKVTVAAARSQWRRRRLWWQGHHGGCVGKVTAAAVAAAMAVAAGSQWRRRKGGGKDGVGEILFT